MNKTFLITMAGIFCVINSFGQFKFEWGKSFGGFGAEYSKSIAHDKSGNAYIAGISTETVDFDPGPDSAIVEGGPYPYAFISKFDSEGKFVWVKSLKGMSNFYNGSISIAVDNSNNIYAAGAFNYFFGFNPDSMNQDMVATGLYSTYILKIDSNGNYIWKKKLDVYGSGDYAKGKVIQTDSSGNIFIGGVFKGETDFDPGSGVWYIGSHQSSGLYLDDVFVVKLDKNGNLIWIRNIAAVNIENMETNAAGDVVFSGSFSGTVDFNPDSSGVYNLIAATGNVYFCKLDASGNFKWAKSITAPQNNFNCTSISMDKQSGLYALGNFADTIDVDPDTSVYQLKSKGYNDILLVKLDKDGNFVWGKSFGESGYDYGYSVSAGDYNYIYVLGGFSDSIDVDPSLSESKLYPKNAYAGSFIAKYDDAGNFIRAFRFGESGGLIDVDERGNVYVSSSFQVSVELWENPSSIVTSNGYYDVSVEKLSQLNVGIEERNSAYDFSVYPNPVSDNVIFNFSNQHDYADMFVQFYNSLGQVLLQQRINSSTEVISCSELSQGVYFYRVYSDNHPYKSGKFVKE